MMRSYVPAFSILLAIASADAAEVNAPLPVWLSARIAALEKLPAASPPRFFARTTYQGKPAYYLSPTCCDIPSELYDEAGSLLCHPDGGFAGGDGRCPSFTLIGPISVVWRQAERVRAPASATAR